MKKNYLRYGFMVSLIMCAFAVLVSCSVGGGDDGVEGDGTSASISLAAGDASIPADGSSSTTVTVTLTDSSGGAVPAGTSVTFSTTLGTFPGGVTSSTATTPDESGKVSVSLIAGTVAGDATVTATSNSVSQNVTVEFTDIGGGAGCATPGVPASIEVYSTQRDSISVAGSGEPETSLITFIVKDINGCAVADATAITFSIVGGGVGGGESLSSGSDTTSAGYVDTTLQSGTKAGTVKVNAQFSPSVTTNVSIAIQGGPPYGEHLGLNPVTLNIAGLKEWGLEDIMTMRVTDKYFNNVPDGTPVYFTTNYAGITGSDTTESNEGESGSFATATLTSQWPDPSDGFVTPATSTQSGTFARVLCMAIDTANIIYLGTDGGGVFKTTDGGTNWSQVGVPEKGMTNGIVWDIEIDSENSAIIYAATDEGVFRSQGSGDEWERIDRAKEVTGESPAGNGGDLDTTDAGNDGYSDQPYTIDYSSNMIRSKTHVYLDGVETYEYVYTSATTIRFIVKDLGAGGEAITIDYTTTVMIPPDYPIHALALWTDVTGDPLNLRYIYAGTYGKGVYRSTNGGFSWTAINSGLADQDVLSLAIDPGDNTILYAGTQGGGVFRTPDADVAAPTWVASNSGLPASVIHAITIDPNTTARLYVGTEQDGVYYTTNSATTWTAPTTNVTSTHVTKIVLDSTATPADEIYAATYGDGTDPLGGVYKSSDRGDTWTRLTALAENHVHALGIIEAATDTLFAGTWGRNLFKSTDGGTTWSASSGSAPDEVTNQIFATSRVLFSGNTAIVRVQTDTTWQGAGGDDYLNDGTARSCIYHNGSASFVFTVQDANGNPLVEGTTISASVDEGRLAGNTSETLADTQTNTNYGLTWTDNITGTDNLTGSLTITVTSDNGNVSTTLVRTLIKPLAVEISTTTPATNAAVTVTPSGGSETDDVGDTQVLGTGGYTIDCPNAGDDDCDFGDTVDCTASGVGSTTETVTVRDDVTGETVSATWTTQ